MHTHTHKHTFSQTKDKQIKDLEDVIFFLQDQITKVQKTAGDSQTDISIIKPIVTRLDAGNPAAGAGRGAGRKAMPSPPGVRK
jgi:hypothetical protein